MSNLEKSKVTVVVPTKNRPIALASLLGSLVCQSLPQFEVSIALNGPRSWDTYLNKLVMALEMRQVRVKIHSCFEMTFAELHEYMIADAQTEYICRLDDDHVPTPNYLQNLLDVIERDEQIGAAGGVVLHPEVQDYEFSQRDFLAALATAKERGILNTILQLKRHPTDCILEVPDLYSTFIARKETIEKVGGIATCYKSSGYREETDLTLRMTLAGYKQYVVPKAVVLHMKADQEGERKSQEVWQSSQGENQKLFNERIQKLCKDIVQRALPIWEKA